MMRVMCDTMFVPSSPARSVPALFGKNSDRHPDEPQVMTLAPGSRWASFLSRPVWMRGAEMGINAKGVVIGNEAVFSRWKPAHDGTLGMDILRMALEEAATARDAVDFIAHFVETRNQGGNGAYKGRLYYDNSYLVADFAEAWIIETAGHRWAARRASTPAAISNSYALGSDFDRSDGETAAERTKTFSWKQRVANPLYGFITKGDVRRSCSLSAISAPDVCLESVFGALRAHGPRINGMRSVCMHGGGLVNNATTSSMVVELLPADHRAVIWFTASSAPCLSLYRPAMLEEEAFRPLWLDYDYAEGSQAALEHWKRRRKATGSLKSSEARGSAFVAERDEAQAQLVRLMREHATARDHRGIDARIGDIVRAFELKWR